MARLWKGCEVDEEECLVVVPIAVVVNAPTIDLMFFLLQLQHNNFVNCWVFFEIDELCHPKSIDP